MVHPCRLPCETEPLKDGAGLGEALLPAWCWAAMLNENFGFKPEWAGPGIRDGK